MTPGIRYDAWYLDTHLYGVVLRFPITGYRFGVVTSPGAFSSFLVSTGTPGLHMAGDEFSINLGQYTIPGVVTGEAARGREMGRGT
jgi:hypothetical protein